MFRIPGEGNGIFRGVGAGTGDHRYPAVHVFHTEFNGPHPFVIAHGAGLTGGAADNDGICSVFQLEIQEPPQNGQVHGLFGEGRDDSYARAGEKWRAHGCTSYTVRPCVGFGFDCTG